MSVYLFNVTLPGCPPPKKNSRRVFARGRRVLSLPSVRHEVWYAEMMPRVLKGWHGRPLDCVKVELNYYLPDRRRRDLTNMSESVMDLLVKARIIKDDDVFHVPDVHLVCHGVDKVSPRVEVCITFVPKE
mgnify:CR=1 FL=1